jgi:hypothetical protein
MRIRPQTRRASDRENSLAHRSGEFLAGARNGNRDAFLMLYDLHKSDLYMAASYLSSNRIEAERGTEQAFIEVFRHLEGMDGRQFSQSLHAALTASILTESGASRPCSCIALGKRIRKAKQAIRENLTAANVRKQMNRKQMNERAHWTRVPIAGMLATTTNAFLTRKSKQKIQEA